LSCSSHPLPGMAHQSSSLSLCHSLLVTPHYPIHVTLSPCYPLFLTLSVSPSVCHPVLVTLCLSYFCHYDLPAPCHPGLPQSPSPCHPLRSEVSMSPFVCHAVHVTLYRCHPVSIFLSPRLSHPLLGTLWSRCNPISFILYSLPVMLSLSPYLAISVTLFLSGAGEEGGEVTTDT